MAAPLTMAIGVAVDYSRLSLVRSELQSAADSGVLAVVSKAGETYKTGGAFDYAWTLAKAEDDAKAWFTANYSEALGYKITDTKVAISTNASVLDAKLNVSASVQTTFLNFAGVGPVTIKVASEAAASLAPYMDVHVLADNSPSMALGATPADIAKLESLTGCAFACHDLSGRENSYKTAVDNNITLRIDATRESISSMIATMKSAQQQYSQFRVAAYHFGDKIELQQLTNYVTLTTNLTKAEKDALRLKLMTLPYANYNRNMATNYKKMLDAAATAIGPAGSGATTLDRRKLLMLITDGVNTTNMPTTCPGVQTPWGQCQTPIDPAWCSALKSSGVKIAILYTTYYPVGGYWYNDWIKPFQATIPTKLKDCASPGMFAQVEPHQGIEEAMRNLFFASYPQPRLIN